MTNTVKVISHNAHSLIQVWDVNGPDRTARLLVTEYVVDPGEVKEVHIWGTHKHLGGAAREVVVCEIPEDHPMVTGIKPPAQPEAVYSDAELAALNRVDDAA